MREIIKYYCENICKDCKNKENCKEQCNIVSIRNGKDLTVRCTNYERIKNM